MPPCIFEERLRLTEGTLPLPVLKCAFEIKEKSTWQGILIGLNPIGSLTRAGRVEFVSVPRI